MVFGHLCGTESSGINVFKEMAGNHLVTAESPGLCISVGEERFAICSRQAIELPTLLKFASEKLINSILKNLDSCQ